MAEVLRADLGRVRLASLLQLAEGEMFGGRLVLPGGEIGLRDGDIVSARCGGLEGADAVRELFLVQRGAASLVPGPAEGARLGQTLALVMEGCRVADEWDRVGPLVLGARGELTGLPQVVVRALDGRRTLLEVTRAAGVPVVAVLDPALRLLDEGLLVEVAPPRREEAPPAEEPLPAEPEPESYWSALEVGRAHLRGGELERAERAFRLALAARPGDRIATQNLRRVHVLRDAEASR